MLSLTRLHPTDPLLSPRDLDWEKNGVFNPGVTIYQGKIALLYRAFGADKISRFGLALTSDGVSFSYAGDKPVFGPDPTSTYEDYGVEDPRITYLNNRYAVVYTAASKNTTELYPDSKDWKTRVSLAYTKDFSSFERKGVIIHSYNDKNAALFPRMWGDDYYLYHRRHPSIWLSKSRDLNTWEDVCTDSCMVVQPDSGSWDNDRIGIGASPIYTDYGWLVFYHGRDNKGVYRLSAFLADLDTPDKIIARLPYPLLEPELPFEREGYVPNVVFTCGAVEAGENYWVYYGGADYAIGGAYVNKQQLLEELMRYRATVPFQVSLATPVVATSTR